MFSFIVGLSDMVYAYFHLSVILRLDIGSPIAVTAQSSLGK